VIEEARKKAKLTKAELARRIGADRSYITKIENGQIEPKVSTFYQIASALGFSVGLTPKWNIN
jgi:transcriptional regulator with XRE-family HTH domain